MWWIGSRHATDPPAGRGAERWQRLAVATLVVGLAAGSALLVVRHEKADDPAIGGYPQRIGFERPSDPLPERPGPLAATLYDNDFGTGRDLGVSATGHLWELPTGTSTLSPSGTLLLTQDVDGNHHLGVHDLSSGDRWELDGIPSGWDRTTTGVYWSQDETTVLATVNRARPSGGDAPAVLDLATGFLVELDGGVPAGFRSPSQPVTVHQKGGRGASIGFVVTTTDLDTGDISDLRLRLESPWLGHPEAGLVASVSPDGRTILLVEDTGDRSVDTAVRLFSLTDGTELAPGRVRDWDGCPPSWRGQDPVLPITSQPGGSGSTRWAGALLLSGEGSSSLVAVHPRLQSSCLQLTDAALTAGPRWAFFGTSTAIWTWYTFPALVAATLLSLGVLILLTTSRRMWTGRAGRTRNRGTRYPSGLPL